MSAPLTNRLRTLLLGSLFGQTVSRVSLSSRLQQTISSRLSQSRFAGSLLADQRRQCQMALRCCDCTNADRHVMPAKAARCLFYLLFQRASHRIGIRIAFIDAFVCSIKVASIKVLSLSIKAFSIIKICSLGGETSGSLRTRSDRLSSGTISKASSESFGNFKIQTQQTRFLEKTWNLLENSKINEVSLHKFTDGHPEPPEQSRSTMVNGRLSSALLRSCLRSIRALKTQSSWNFSIGLTT